MLSVCRICLSTDRNLQTLGEPLNNFHDEICDFSIDDYTLYCTECIYLLKKFYFFKTRCQQANAILKKWKKQSPKVRLQLHKLKHKLPKFSLSISNDKNHAIYLCKLKKEDNYNTVNDINNSSDTSLERIDVDNLTQKSGYVIIELTTALQSNSNSNGNADDEIFGNIVNFATDTNKIGKTVDDNDKATVNNLVIEKDALTCRDKLDTDEVIFSDKLKSESDNNKIDIRNVKKNKRDVQNDTLFELYNDSDVKIEELDGSHENLDGLGIIADELKTEDTENAINLNKYNGNDDALCNEDIINSGIENDDLDDNINNDDISNYGGSEDTFDIEKLLNEALDSNDSSDDEFLIKTRNKAIAEKKASKKRKSKSDSGFIDDELEPSKKKRKRQSSKRDLEEVRCSVLNKFENVEVKDKDGNFIDKDCILDNLEKMHKYTYNKIKRFCIGRLSLTPEAIQFLARVQKRYGKEYSSVFITKHLTTQEEILKEFKNRMNHESYVKSEHKCTLCYKGFKYAKMLDYHMAEYHNPDRPHKCELCAMRFSRPQGLNKHFAGHRVVYKCKLCPLVTNYTTVMETHFNIHKGVQYPCSRCNAVFKSPPSLAAHMNYLHQSKFICTICARNFHSETGVYQHKLRKHPNEHSEEGPPSAKCEACDITFISDEVYRTHLSRTHSEAKTLVAGVDMFKKRKQCLNRKTPKFTCRVCGGMETSMGGLMWHFRTTHPNENFETVPMARSRDGYKYLCHECGKGFSMITDFTDHKNVHTGARPYACSQCPKAFHRRAHLRNHLEFHSPPNKECPQCGKKFHSKSNLSNHIRQHTGIRRYVCDVCSKTFIHRSSLNAHIRGVHLHIRRTRKPNKQTLAQDV